MQTTIAASALCPPLSRGPLACSVVSDITQLELLAPAWKALLERGASNEPVLTPLWLLTWWRLFGGVGKHELKVGLFHEGERLVGIAPLVLRRHWYRPGIPFRRLEPLASCEDPVDQICSDYLNVIAERGAEERVAQAFAEALAAGTFGPWDELVFPVMDGEDPMPGLLTDALNEEGLNAACTETDVALYIPLPATWDDYVKTLSSQKRYRLRHSLRVLEKWADNEWVLKWATTPEELEEGKRILVTLHNDRWSRAGTTGAFHSGRFVAFHETVMSHLLEEGALDLVWLSVRGEPIAALYSIVWSNKIYFYQCGRKVDVPKGVRPGIALLAYRIQKAIESGMREFDFLAGMLEYKLELARDTRPIVRVRASRGSPRELARQLTEWTVARARSWLRPVPAAASLLPPSAKEES